MAKRRAVKRESIQVPVRASSKKVTKGHKWTEVHAHNLQLAARLGLVQGITTESELVEAAWRLFCEEHGLPIDELLQFEFKRVG